jgi:hypothetical protein
MVPMRSPDDDGTTGDDGSVSGSLGEGFGATLDDLIDGDFGEGDLSDDVTVDEVEVEVDEDADFEFPGDDGDGLTDDEASNVLEEILEDVFGADGPEVLDEVEPEPDFDFDISG